MNLRNWKLEIRNWKFKDGIAALGTTLLLGAVIVEIALVSALLSYLFGAGNLGVRLAAEALSAARAGIDDGLLRVLRGTNSTDSPIVISVGGATANVEICDGSTSGCLSSINPQKRKITSTGTRLSKKRKLVSVVEVDTNTRLMKIESITELPL